MRCVWAVHQSIQIRLDDDTRYSAATSNHRLLKRPSDQSNRLSQNYVSDFELHHPVQPTVQSVGTQVPQASQADSADLPRWNDHQHGVNSSSPKSVQGMKTYAATIGIKNRVGQQVVGIDDDCAGHDESSRPPMLAPHDLCNNKWDYQMVGVVENVSKNV